MNNPLFIVSPTPRCGTTLMQRLFNSSRKIVVFGEDKVLYQSIPHMLYLLRARFPREKDLQAVRMSFKDNSEFWSNDLVAPTEELLKASVNWAQEIFSIYAQNAQVLGAAAWGAKFPLHNFAHISTYLDYFENCRVLCIYRKLEDVIRSCKTRGWIQSTKDLQKFCMQWKENSMAAMQEKRENFLLFSYEELCNDSENTLKKLESFSGIDGIDRSVLKRKINTWKGSGSYLSPQELSDREKSFVRGYSEDLKAKNR